jgi:hypothetical protein
MPLNLNNSLEDINSSYMSDLSEEELSAIFGGETVVSVTENGVTRTYSNPNATGFFSSSSQRWVDGKLVESSDRGGFLNPDETISLVF